MVRILYVNTANVLRIIFVNIFIPCIYSKPFFNINLIFNLLRAA